jgi:hypothetical protein
MRQPAGRGVTLLLGPDRAERARDQLSKPMICGPGCPLPDFIARLIESADDAQSDSLGIGTRHPLNNLRDQLCESGAFWRHDGFRDVLGHITA